MSRTAATAEYLAAKAVDLRDKSTAAFDIAISKNPDKARSMLNLWFVPDFKPTFFDEEERYSAAAGSGLSSTGPALEDDVGLLDPAYSSSTGEPGGKEGRYPVRMIDLDTNRLVDYPDIGAPGQYCILSHSWKGNEVNYKYVVDAKSKAYSRIPAAAQGANGNFAATADVVENLTEQSDIEMIRNQCSQDIADQEEKISALAHDGGVLAELGLGDADDVVGELLSLRVEVQIAEKGADGRGGIQKAKRKLAEALAVRDYENLEDQAFRKLLDDFGIVDNDDAVRHETDGGDDQPADPNADVAAAEANLVKEQRRQDRESAKVQFFERHRNVREAVDGLISCIQRSKSVTKIEQALERSREVFDLHPFPQAEKRYLWVDSCCINRADDGEYARSISAMGEWYKNAQFCLVHLDTKRDVPAEALTDWEALRRDGHPPPNIATFADIEDAQPEWSTRAWTLQELVMSKMTFYVNSSWQFLSRPVESLGAWYYLCPYVALYTKIDTMNPYSSILEDVGSLTSLLNVLDQTGSQYQPRRSAVEGNTINMARKIIAILEILDFRVPGEIEMETARVWISRSVHVSVSGFTSLARGADIDRKTSLLEELLRALEPYLHLPKPWHSEELTRHAINILLKCLVKLIEGPILDDRTYVAHFGNARGLELWQRGLVRSHFSTHKVMSLVCDRDATVETDRAYSLMGLLGVRFPTFPAEGLTRALTRLLDEVVISSNDVSVFNWSGKQYGNPVRGRSLYPSSPEAYTMGRDERRKKRKDEELASRLQIRRYDVLNNFHAISDILVEAIVFARERKHVNIPLLWIVEILRVIQGATFERLRPHIPNIGKILTYIETDFTSDSKTAQSGAPDMSQATPFEDSGGQGHKSGNSYFAPFNSLQPQIKTPSIPDLRSFKAPSFGRKKTSSPASTPTATASPWTTGRGLGGFKAPSIMGFGKKSPELPQSLAAPPETQNPPSEADAAVQTSNPTTPSLVSAESSKHPLSEEVLSYIRGIEGEVGNGKELEFKSEAKLPAQLEESLAKIPAPGARPLKGSAMASTGADPAPVDGAMMTSPNPIVLMSSGIEGLFDVQRVVVSMPQPERLRRQIRNAVSPDQKITGWCTISTGFAVVLVSFACPRQILGRELDVVQAVEAKVLGAGSDGLGIKNRGLDRLKDRINSDLKEDHRDDVPGLLSPEFENLKEEGNKVSRMIKFVQEPRITAVAGEWVLARFSGVPGAKWFLCHLELGGSSGSGSGGDLYGRRIATDEIDFRHASPEMGLMRYWEHYMFLRKNRLCDVLRALMDSRDWGRYREDVGGSLTDRIVKSARSYAGYSDVKIEGNDAAAVASGDGDAGADDDSDSEDGDLVGSLKELGGMALTVAGASVVENLYEWRAERLRRNLDADVIRKFPHHMRAALESLNDNRDLMPSMFHSAKKVHMF